MTANVQCTVALHEALKLDDEPWYRLTFAYVEHWPGDDIDPPCDTEFRHCTCGSTIGRVLEPAPTSRYGIGNARGPALDPHTSCAERERMDDEAARS